MSKIKKLLPFRFMPGSWGLKGKSYEKAKAEYELEGYELEIKLSELEFGHNPTELAHQRAIIDFEYDKISDYEMEIQIANLLTTEIEKKKKILEINYNYHKINEQEYDKQMATLNNEPWVRVVRIGINKENPAVAGEIELDWNDQFVQKLREHGHVGPSDYIIVEQWFNLLCSAIASENGIRSNPDIGLPGLGDGDLDGGLPPGLKEYR